MKSTQGGEEGFTNDQGAEDLGTTHHDHNGARAEEDEELQGEAKRNYQTQAARANYLCLDRPDIGFATKEAMRRLSAPTKGDEVALKKLGRYLLGCPRVVSLFRYGE